MYDLLPSWVRSLRSANLSPRTIQVYEESARRFTDYLAALGRSIDPSDLRKEDVEDWMAHLLETRKPATANVRYRSLQRFMAWLLEEGEVQESPMARTRPPRVPEDPVPVIPAAVITKMLDHCSGPDFGDRRDRALIRFFADTGARLGEVAGLELDDVDLDDQSAWVTGKGSRKRLVPLGNKLVTDLDRYLRTRRRHRHAGLADLWLGRYGKLTESGMYKVVRARGKEAGLPELHPHALRHTFSHNWQAEGGSESGLMQVAGWKSRAMLGRYGASAASERAREEHRRLSPGDRV